MPAKNTVFQLCIPIYIGMVFYFSYVTLWDHDYMKFKQSQDLLLGLEYNHTFKLSATSFQGITHMSELLEHCWKSIAMY